MRVFLALLSLAISSGCDRDAEPPKQFPVDALGRFYQAVGHLEMDQFDEAAAILTELDKTSGHDPAVLANLAVAHLGRREPEQGVALARRAAAATPDNTDIAVILAVALHAHDQPVEALSILRRAVKGDPHHVNALWLLIDALESPTGDGTQAELLSTYDRLLGRVPRNVVVLLQSAQARAQAGDLDLALRHVDRVRAMFDADLAKLRTELDRLAEAGAAGNPSFVKRTILQAHGLMKLTNRYQPDRTALGGTLDKVPSAVPHPIHPLDGKPTDAIRATVRFEDQTEALGLAIVANDPSVLSIAIGTVTDDRAPALFVVRDDKPGSLFVRRDGRFVDVTAALGLGGLPSCRSARWVDLNNDRRMDLVLSGQERVMLLLSTSQGRFVDATETHGQALRKASIGVTAFDFDNDGDLDLIGWDTTALTYCRNDGEGTLTEVTEIAGLPTELAGVVDITAVDLDDDGDIDLCVTTGDGDSRWRVYANERNSRFREVTADIVTDGITFTSPPVIADFDNNGWYEVLDAATGNSIEIGADFAVRKRTPTTQPVSPATGVVVVDIDRDGRLDLVRVGDDGSTNQSGVTVDAGDSLLAFDLDADGAVDLLSSSGRAWINKTDGAGHWFAVSLAALIEGSTKFNAFGIGSTIEIRAGAMYQKRRVTGATTWFGLGPYTHADVTRITWPNGAYTSYDHRLTDRMSLAGDQVIVETQSLKGSCPYLYAWNGEAFEFVTDVLWRSALGMPIRANVLGHHQTADDYFKIPGEQLRVRDGRYVLQFTEELWETAYFDYTRLMVVDHPVGTDIFVDEKCEVPPYAPHRIYRVRSPRPVKSAVDNRGRKLTDILAKRDGRFVTGYPLTRYQGVAEDHDLILDLGAFAADAEIRLFLTGWLWPTDAGVNVAASQNATLDVRPPSLSVIDEHGAWSTAIGFLGFPSGKNKTMVVDLTGKFAGDEHRVKIATNMMIHWDQVFFTVGEQSFDMRVTELPITAADLHDRGCSYEYRQIPDGPFLPDYAAVDPHRRWRDLVGDYTRFGDVTELLTAPDSMYVITKAGDEITLEFDASRVSPLPDGYRRDFVIHTDGWLKDGDLNTAAGKTVGPLPFRGMSAYPYPADEAYPATAEYAAYRKNYNTRSVDQQPFRDAVCNPSN
jgi:hypothetical protein